MNIFRFAGDMTHLLSFLVLLLKIRSNRSCRGISLRTQQLYATVFVCRYLDLFSNHISMYNTIMKVVFIGLTFTIIYYITMDRVVKQTYDREQDAAALTVAVGGNNFDVPHVVLLLVPCAVLALVFNHKLSVMEVLWTFSIYLEAVAILPQLVLLQRTSNIDNMTGNYIFLLGSYRGLYILNWVYRYFTEPHYKQWIVWLSGIVQTALYADFFYYYVKSWKNNERLKLPA